MGHHINAKGEFQSDKYPALAPDKIVLSLKDPRAQRALRRLAFDYSREDPELAADLLKRLGALGVASVEHFEADAADSFWDAENSELHHSSLEECLYDSGNGEEGSIVHVLRGDRCPDAFGFWLPALPSAGNDDIRIFGFATRAEAEAALAIERSRCIGCGKICAVSYLCDDDHHGGPYCGACFDKHPCTTTPHGEGCATSVFTDDPAVVAAANAGAAAAAASPVSSPAG